MNKLTEKIKQTYGATKAVIMDKDAQKDFAVIGLGVLTLSSATYGLIYSISALSAPKKSTERKMYGKRALAGLAVTALSAVGLHYATKTIGK